MLCFERVLIGLNTGQIENVVDLREQCISASSEVRDNISVMLRMALIGYGSQGRPSSGGRIYYEIVYQWNRFILAVSI